MRSRRGFTLLETIMAIFVMVLLLSVSSMSLRQVLLLQHRAVDCADDVEASLRLGRDLRRDLSEGRLKAGGVEYVQEPEGVARRAPDGGKRLYRGLTGWEISTGILTKAAWEAKPRGGRGRPPRFEMAVRTGP